MDYLQAIIRARVQGLTELVSLSSTAVIFYVFLSVNAFGQDFGELERIIRAELREKNAVGAGVAIIKNDRLIFTKGFGAANVEMNVPITPDTIFQIGSITKTFTAAIVLAMAEGEKLKLDAPVESYAKNLSPKLSRVTLSQLLSHTTGIIDGPDEYGAETENFSSPRIQPGNGVD